MFLIPQLIILLYDIEINKKMKMDTFMQWHDLFSSSSSSSSSLHDSNENNQQQTKSSQLSRCCGALLDEEVGTNLKFYFNIYLFASLSCSSVNNFTLKSYS